MFNTNCLLAKRKQNICKILLIVKKVSVSPLKHITGIIQFPHFLCCANFPVLAIMYNAYRLQYIQAVSQHNLQVKLSTCHVMQSRFSVPPWYMVASSPNWNLTAPEIFNVMMAVRGEGARRISYFYHEDGSHMFSKALVPICHITQWDNQEDHNLHWHAVVFIYLYGISPQESQIMSPSRIHSVTLSHLHTGCIWIHSTHLAFG